MAKQLASALAVFALSSTLLAGCGATPRPMTATLQGASGGTVAAKDYYSVSNAKRAASDALDSYNSLRNQWLAAYSDTEKDRIEDRMLSVLSQALGDVRNAVSAEAGASGYDSRQVFNLVDAASNQYEDLRRQWSATNDVNQQRDLSNRMQTVMVTALQRVLKVRS